MSRAARIALSAIAVGAVLAVVASRDAWFDEPPGFTSPAGGMSTLLFVMALLATGVAVAALIRTGAAAERLAATFGIVLAGAVLALLVALGSGMDEPARGGWLAAIASAAVGGGAGYLLGLNARMRAALVLLAVLAAGVAVALPPDWSHPEVQVIR